MYLRFSFPIDTNLDTNHYFVMDDTNYDVYETQVGNIYRL